MHPRHLTALTPSDLTNLATLLYLPHRLIDRRTGTPSPLWLATQARSIARLPKPLQRPHDWLTRLSMSAKRRLRLTLDDFVPQCAVLCPAHADMNPWVVRRAFFLLSREVTGRLDALRSYLGRPGRYNLTNKKLNGNTVEEMRQLVHRLAGVAALWMASAAVERMGLRREELPPRIDSQCEACIVSAVGADAQALCDLRAGLLGRSHKRRTPPVLLRLVEAWVARFEWEGRDGVLRESERLGKMVKGVRRAVHEVNKSERQRKGGEKAKRAADHRPRHGDSSTQSESLGKQPFYFSYPSSTLPSKGYWSTAHAVTTLRHYHERGGQSDNTVSRPAAIGDKHVFPHPHNPSCRPSTTNTIGDIINADDGDDDTDADDVDDAGSNEADPLATDRLQRASSRWYGSFNDVSEQHPAFRQSAADVASWWASAYVMERSISPASESAIPVALRIRSKEGDVAPPRMPFENDAEDEEDDGEPFDLAQWTDGSVPTFATSSNSIAIGGLNLSPAPTLPMVPSISRAPCVLSGIGLVNVVRRGHGRLAVPSKTDLASSVYSQDGTAMPHPPASSAARRYMYPWAPPPVPMRYDLSTASSQVTAWPGHNNHQPYLPTTSIKPPGNRHRPTLSSSNRSVQTVSFLSHTSLSPGEFQTALDRLSLTDFESEPGYDGCGPGTTFGGHIPEGSVLPGESVSVVDGLNSGPPRRQEKGQELNQVKRDEAFAWALQNGDLERAWPSPVPMSGLEDNSDDCDDCDDSGRDVERELKSVIGLSKVTAKGDKERRRMGGPRNMFSDLTLPGQW